MASKKLSKGPQVPPHVGVGRKSSGPPLPKVNVPQGKTGAGRAGNLKTGKK
jgi:hypothetical protein